MPTLPSRRRSAGNSRCRLGRRNSHKATASKLPKITAGVRCISFRARIAATQTRIVQVLRNDSSYQVFAVHPGVAQAFDVPVSLPGPAGQRRCTITLQGDGPFVVTGLSFA